MLTDQNGGNPIILKGNFVTLDTTQTITGFKTFDGVDVLFTDGGILIQAGGEDAVFIKYNGSGHGLIQLKDNSGNGTLEFLRDEDVSIISSTGTDSNLRMEAINLFLKLLGATTSEKLTVQNSSGATLATIDGTGIAQFNILRVIANAIVLASGGNSATITAPSNTAPRTYTLPDASGQIALATWMPSNIDLGSFLTSGASFFINGGAGIYLSMPSGTDSTIYSNLSLSNSTANYDGSNLAVVIKARISSNGTAGATVGLILKYAIVGDGDNTTTTFTTVAQQNVDVSSRLQDVQFSTQLATMVGVVGKNTLMLDITRNSQGAGADTYTGAFEITSIQLIKV